MDFESKDVDYHEYLGLGATQKPLYRKTLAKRLLGTDIDVVCRAADVVLRADITELMHLVLHR